MEQSQWTNVCRNPFNKTEHSSKKKSLRQILPWMLEKVPSLILGAKICDSCRKELARSAVESDPLDNSGNEFDSTYICQQESLESVNECLEKPQLLKRS